MHTFLDKIHQGGKYFAQIASHQAELRRGHAKYFFKRDIRNILHANIDVHRGRLISEFPGYGLKCIEKIQSYCANMPFADKSSYDRIFQQVTYKGGESAMNHIK